MEETRYRPVLTAEQMDFCRTIADNDLNILAASRDLYQSRGSAFYQCKKIKAQTGLDPRKFYDMMELLDARVEG